MKKSFMAKFKLFLTILLALTMAFTLLSTVACKDNDDSSSSDTTETITELTDNQLIKNGDFEYGTANKKVTEYPVYSSVNWARANGSIGNSSAPTSSYTSGIIDTREFVYEYDEDGYVKLDNGTPVLAKEDDKEVQLYQAIARNKSGQFPELKNQDGTTVKDEDNNTVYYNPRTPSYYALTDYTDEEGALMGGGKVLMINNKYSEESGKGTAQYFSASSEFSLYPGETGKIELWLMTKDLVNPLHTLDSSWNDFGAYIEITTTIGSIATPATRIKNIDTKGEWTKFTFYIDGSNFAQTKLSLKVGLGMGSATLMKNFVEGHAFIDDVAFSVLDNDQTAPTSTDFSYSIYDADGKMNHGDDGEKTSYFDRDFKASNFTILPNDVEAQRANFGEYNFLKSTYEARTDYTEITAFVDCKKPEQTAPAFTDGITKLDNAHEKISSLVNNGGLTYGPALKEVEPFGEVETYTITATNPANVAYETPNFYLDGNDVVDGVQHVKISFWVKTNLVRKGGGISLYLVDKGNNTDTVEPVETAIKEGFVTEKGCNETYDDWTKFTVVVSNTAKNADGDIDARYFSIKMVLGPTAVTESIYSFPIGEVSLANVSVLELVKNDDLDEITAIEKTKDTNVKEVSLSADLNTINNETETEDSYTFTYSKSAYDISNSVVKEIISYHGIVGNHNRVGVENGATTSTQTGTVAGLINTKYLANYGLTADQITAIEKLKDATLEDSDNQEIQPIMINNTANGISYGYIAKSSSTISANSTALISVKVKVIGDATAYIYLVNDDNANFDVLGVNVNRQELISTTYGEDATRFKEKDTLNQTVNGKYQFALTANDIDAYAGDGFATVTFLVKAGNEALNFRVEMWNGARRDADETEKVANNKAGIVLFDEYNFASSVDYTNKTLELKQEFGTDYTDASEQVFTRIPSKVLTDANPENGEVRVYKESDKDATAVAYKSNKFFVLSDLSTINIENEIDEITVEEDTDDDTTDTTTTEETSFSPFLYFTSLAVSLVLIITLLAIAIKHIVSAIKKRKSRSKSYYDANLREKAIENIKKSKETKFKEEYDYDNIESNIIEEETEEVETLEQTEETQENAETVETEETVEETTEETADNTTEETVEETTTQEDTDNQ